MYIFKIKWTQVAYYTTEKTLNYTTKTIPRRAKHPNYNRDITHKV